jgi:hypothetical protein
VETLWETIFNSSEKVISSYKSYFFFIVASLFCSTIFTYYYFLYTHEYPPGSAENIASGTADKVFQTRILMPFLGDFLKPCIPILSFLFGWFVPYPITYDVILQVLNIFFLALLVISIPVLLKMLDCEVSNWCAFVIFIPLSWNYIAINGLIDGAGLFYCYDIPSLTFYVIGLTFFLKGNWLLFYLIFILANLNRESACFISLSGFFLQFKFCKNPKLLIGINKNLFLHILTQTILWIVMRTFLIWIYQGNPGVFFEEPHSMSKFLSRIWNGNSHWAMENAAWFLTLFAGIWLIPVIGFKKLSSFGKKLIFVGIIYVISLYFRSNMMETRVYNELNVIISICAIICLTNLIKTTRGIA